MGKLERKKMVLLKVIRLSSKDLKDGGSGVPTADLSALAHLRISLQLNRNLLLLRKAKSSKQR